MNLRGALISVFFFNTVLAVPDEGIRLSASRQGAEDVQLGWVGGGPTFHVCRSTNPADVTSNEIGQTADPNWLDTPPSGTLFFYRVIGVMTPCTGDGQCPSAEYCGSTSVCLPDQLNGMTCSGDSHCVGSHCANGYCCAAGDCCATVSDCGAYSHAPICETPLTCQGTRAGGLCNGNTCTTQTVADDSACSNGVQSQDCGIYPAVYCTGAVNQAPPECASACAGDAGCDVEAHCDGAACLPDLDLGGSCDETSDCSSNRCSDTVCCNSDCTGICGACNVAGSIGSCSPVPDGTDPAGECPGVSCASYYLGWTGDVCRRKADVTAAQATCGGDNACRSQSEECSAATTPGSIAVTCNAQCQDPNLSTCSGLVPGACVNVNPGNQTCGLGSCQTVAPQCVNGAPGPCFPGPPTTETCNSLDDNCDGVVDNGSFSDGLEPNNSCASFRTLATVGSDGTQTYTTPTLYASGDVDYYRFLATETDSSCGCGVLSFDEDYTVRADLTVPSGAGVYEFCISMTCDSWAGCFNASPGTTTHVTWDLDGACGPGSQDDYSIYLRVRGTGSPGFSCHNYTLSYTFDAGLCR